MRQVSVHESAQGQADSGVADIAFGAQLSQTRAIWHSYLKGQLANVGKAALWWSTFGIVAVAMLESPLALGATRGPFNLALLISSPLAVAAAEKWSIRKLLLVTTLGRFCIWSIMIPISWIIFHNCLQWQTVLWSVFIASIFLDGIQVAFSNAVDIDCGGLDTLSSAYDLPLTDFLRYRFTTVHQLVFDFSFILFTPPTILILVFFSSWALRNMNQGVQQLYIPAYITGPDLSLFVLTVGLAFVFGCLSFLSLKYYIRGIPPQEQVAEQTQIQHSLPIDAGLSQKRERPQALSLWESYKGKLAEITHGFFIVLSNASLRWRLILLATETALEDTLVSIIIPMTALNAVAFLGHTDSKTVAALISVVIIAVGKLGGVLAGIYLASNWNNDTTALRHRARLFELVFLSSLSIIFLPYGYGLAAAGLDGVPHSGTVDGLLGSSFDLSPISIFHWLQNRSGLLGCLLFLLGIFLFFVFSTGPKIGFASLIQHLVTQEEDVASVFGFVGMFVTITDGLTIVLFNLLLSGIVRFQLGLWVIFAIYALHGLFEYLFGRLFEVRN